MARPQILNIDKIICAPASCARIENMINEPICVNIYWSPRTTRTKRVRAIGNVCGTWGEDDALGRRDSAMCVAIQLKKNVTDAAIEK